MFREASILLTCIGRSGCAAMLALTCAALPAFAADVPENVDALLQRYHELGQFNGAALVVDGGAIALQKGYGKASLRWSIDNSPSTRFLVGSITKSITALLVLRLADAERLNLDANVSEYLDYYRRDVGERITLRHLLTHTDGLPNYTANGQFWQPDVLAAPLTTRDFITQFCSGDLAFEPGSDYRYGNAGYSILGAIVETVTGETYADAARRLILEPLGMHRTGVHVPGAMIPELAGGYERAPGGLRPAAPIPRPLFAAGSLYSTLDDLLAYDRGLRKGHALEDSVLDAALFTRADAIDGTFAYGWNVGALDLNRAIPSTRYTATNGEINGYNAIMVRIPDAEQLIVLLNNTGETLLFDIVSNILRVLNDLPAVDPEPTLRDAFVSRLDEQTVTAAVTYYRQQRGLLPNDALFFPWTMRITAGHLIADGRYADAAVLLKLNLETNTNDARSLDLLATAQMRSGQPKAAEESLQAALAIEPGNPWFAERLARLRADNPD